MKRVHLVALLFVVSLLYLMPMQASAYSYGDASTEDVAETYKLIEAALAEATPNWTAAEEAYKVRRSEIVSHFGEPVGVTLDDNFRTKDAKLLLANFKSVLVMNLDRRFNYAVQGLNDYAQAKLLLAKAKATFDTLAPHMKSDMGEITKAFDAALEALGNPGLFGVGKKEMQPEVFKEKVAYIYNKVKPVFPYKAYVKAASAEKAPTPTPAPAQTAKPEPPAAKEPAQKQEPAAAQPAAKPAETKPEAVPAPAAPVSDEKAKQEEKKSPDEAKPQNDGAAAAGTPVQPAAESKTAEAVAAEAAETKPQAAETTSASQEAKAAPVEAKPAAAVEGGGERVTALAQEHAPMVRSDKTNPMVSFAVIGGLIVLAGGGFWIARKRKWL